MSSVLHLAELLVQRFGYSAVAVFMIAEGCGIPVPAESMLVTASAFAARHTLSIWGVMIAGSVGGIIGGSAGYAIGALGGMPFIRRFGPRLGLTDDRIDRARRFFRSRGSIAVTVGRFLALLRIVVPMLAGVTRMPFVRFSFFNALGSIVTALVYGALGYEFGRDLPALERHLKLVTLTLLTLGALLLAVLWIRRRQGERARDQSRESRAQTPTTMDQG